MIVQGTSLAVQWLGLHTSTARDPGSIPGRGTKIPQATWCSPPKKDDCPRSGFEVICGQSGFWLSWGLRALCSFLALPSFSNVRALDWEGRDFLKAGGAPGGWGGRKAREGGRRLASETLLPRALANSHRLQVLGNNSSAPFRPE